MKGFETFGERLARYTGTTSDAPTLSDQLHRLGPDWACLTDLQSWLEYIASDVVPSPEARLVKSDRTRVIPPVTAVVPCLEHYTTDDLYDLHEAVRVELVGRCQREGGLV